MPKHLRWKFGLTVMLFIISTLMVLPSFYPNTPSWLKKTLGTEGLKLGLDLQGGMHLVLTVDVDEAVKNALNLSVRDLKDALKRQHINLVPRESKAKDTAIFAVSNKSSIEKIKDILDKDFPNIEISSIDSSKRFPLISFRLKQSEVDFIREHAVEQSLEIIRNRIDQFGVAEPVIVRQGANEIVVQLPGVKDPKRAIKLIGQTAQLEFKMVDEDSGVDLGALIRKAREDGRLKANYDASMLNKALKGQLPRGDKIYVKKDYDSQNKRMRISYILLKDKTLMSGDAIKTAHVRIGGTFNEPYVSLVLTDRGAKIFERITGENVGKRLAIVLDGIVRSAPVIRERIAGGHAQISGSFTHEEAADLAIVLRAGALPAPVKIIQNITVGPSLGRDSIQKGLVAGLVGGLMVLVFMVIYYRISGLIADVAVALNILFLMAVLSLFHATLTLPGIAGIILTIGMGVDSNVLIFERMREEKALGKPLKAYIDGGYDKAFWTIVDAHVTTLITALALFLFGTGPIKGFAVTLSAGIVINLFTAIFGTRIVYDWMLSKGSISELSFMQIVKDTSIQFIEKRNIAFLISGALVALGIISFILIQVGRANLGVDFSGGSMIQYKADRAFSLDKVRVALKDTGIEGYTLQEVPDEHILIIRVKRSVATVGDLEAKVTRALNKKFSGHNFRMESKTEIGSQISKELRQKAIIAILISLAGIIGYLALRFNVSFGVAAAIATFHDVLAVLGVFYLLNIEITLLIVTALLTIAGYSLTDTVVVFDRIRENLKRMPKSDFAAIINKSVNEMLARTIITSLTTLLVVLTLFIFGGVVIHDFALALLLGVIVGTYSSVFVASPIVYIWHGKKAPR